MLWECAHRPFCVSSPRGLSPPPGLERALNLCQKRKINSDHLSMCIDVVKVRP